MRPIVVLLAIVAALTGTPALARAATGPCTPGAGSPRCALWTGTATFVADGDTIDVDVAGDGTRTARRVRLTGINAMELRRYSSRPSRRRGDCHAVEAAARLEHLLRRGHMRVRLAAQDPASRSGGRLRRQVSTRIGGRWIDVASVLLAEGHALWLPNGVEWAWNREYAALSQRAAAQGLRLFDASACGPGPAAGAALSMRVNYDAPGDDRANVDGEWAVVSNGSDSAVPLEGWWFRDSALRRYVFGVGASIPPRGSVTIFAGHGESTTTSFYWGLSAPAFENPTLDARWMGDGAYLFDPRGNLRSWVIYP